MALTLGARLGTYEILGALGAGGMGEVYRARDTKLGRDVAIKVLPASFASDPERLARFEREARLLASLNHPNIGAIYGVEETAGVTALVLELVDGDTLAQTLARRSRLRTEGLGLSEALAIARQIADALDAAHGRGIVHRDLKPANIVITAEGVVKVLDFGLAKATDTRSASLSDERPGDALTHSPTMMGPTVDGVLLGTAPYMSPEQARGKAVDKRTDIWAFGCVLYEMLAGRRAFGGETTTDTLAAILEREPDWSALPPGTPSPIRRLLQRCLERDVKRRLRDIGDARAQLDDAPSTVGDVSPIARPAAKRLERMWWLLAMASAVALSIGTMRLLVRQNVAAREMRLEIVTPPTTDPVSIAISPDGQAVVFAATLEGRSRLWLRRLDSASARPLPRTEEGALPFWSPDGRFVGFFADRQLRRIDIDNGSVQTIAAAEGGRGGTWNRDGTIVFQPTPSPGPLMRASADGGQATPLQQRGRFPQFLRDGRHFLYYVPPANDVAPGVYLGELGTSEARRLRETESAGVYAAPEHVLFVRQGTLFSQRLDASAFVLSGEPGPVAEQVFINGPLFNAPVSASDAGPFIYRTGSAGGLRQFVWVDRAGRQIAAASDPAVNLLSPSMSPDGRYIAVHRQVEGNTDIWIADTTRRLISRFTLSPSTESSPVWSPDGSRIVFARNNKDLYTKEVDGAREERPLLQTPREKWATDWSLDGRFLLFNSRDANNRVGVWALPMTGDRQPFPVAQGDFDERDGQFSPDGRWVSYYSNESGRSEVYVQAFPNPGRKLQVSTNGGAQARWRRDGRELFYIALDGQLMAVSIQLDPNGREIRTGTPVSLFATKVRGAIQTNNALPYMVSRDGDRFLMNTLTEEPASAITVVLNWRPRS